VSEERPWPPFFIDYGLRQEEIDEQWREIERDQLCWFIGAVAADPDDAEQSDYYGPLTGLAREFGIGDHAALARVLLEAGVGEAHPPIVRPMRAAPPAWQHRLDPPPLRIAQPVKLLRHPSLRCLEA